ncbi:hypothetical protein [Cohnella zeiphila]|uniref:Uncharacterized protein n=1 Tax=Cohnella zeiphila TaxID=2761120 RepID=A0A7X0VV99_9BACL|nr:hypothetical protein [Cohnella zeiphila]MBB6731919.1 hypothetical protein [Cohnella zeiphila]
MGREEYVNYLRNHAKIIGWLADEIESDKTITTAWMIDWEVHREEQFLIEPAIIPDTKEDAA